MRRLIIVLLFLSCSLGRGQSANGTIPQIQVTRTWGDLLATAPITVEIDKALTAESNKMLPPSAPKPTPGKPESITVWVGIDRDHAASNGSVLLYCAAKSASFASPLLLWPNNLGPLAVRVEWPDAPGNAQFPAAVNPEQGGFYPSHFVLNDSSYVLFAQSVPLGAAATYPVRLLLPVMMGPNAKRIVLAETKVIVTDSPSEPWTPWGEVGASNNNEPSSGANDVHVPWNASAPSCITKTMWNPRGGVAIPKAIPEPFIFPTAPAPSTPLPHLLPEPSDPPIALTQEGNTFIVRINQKQLFYSYPEDFFLTRWWLNDKPWVPDPSFQEGICRAEDTVGVFLKEAHFVLDFQPERLEAKKGNKIGMQLLYCPWGWQYSGRQQQMELMALYDDNPPASAPSFTFLSNRIDFIYSGDPKNIQQK